MMGEWPLVAIGDISEVVGGSTPSTKDPENFNGDIPWLTPKDLSGFHDRYVIRGERNLSSKGLASCSARLLPPGTVLLTTRAPIGYVAIAGSEIATNQGFRSLVLRDGVCPEFVYYCLKANKTELERHASGSTFREISGSSLKQIRIPLPEESKQRAIAHILGTLDDKIELNRRMNRTLEGMARAIFKCWFIDFDPVIDNAILSGKPIPDEFSERAAVRREILARRNSSEGVAGQFSSTSWRGDRGKGAVAYRRLFPDEFQDSELGPIPKGWKVSTVGDEFDVTMGQSPPGSTYNEKGDGLPFFQGRRDFGFRYPTKRVSCTAPKRIAETGDTLVSVRAPVGDINMAADRMCVGRGLAGVRHRSGSRSYTYYSMRSLRDGFREYESEGTVFGAINKRQFAGLELLSPSAEAVEEFENHVRAVDDMIELNAQEFIRLAGVRDVLLPELMSGRVP